MTSALNHPQQSSGNNTNGAVSKPDILKIDREAEHFKKGSASHLFLIFAKLSVIYHFYRPTT